MDVGTSCRQRPKRIAIKSSKKFCLCVITINALIVGGTIALDSELNQQQQMEIRQDYGLSSKTRNATYDLSSAESHHPSPNPITCFATSQTGENKCIQVIQASFGEVYHNNFNSTLEFRLIYTYSDSRANFAVSVESPDVDVDHPIMFVVRQQKAVTSWELPYILESSSGHQGKYRSFRRTLCPQLLKGDPLVNNIVIDITTSNRKNVSFNLRMTLERDFSVGLEEERRLFVTPSENRFYKFTFPSGVTQVAVKSRSFDDICLTVSVQSPQCPVFDTIYNVEYQGLRQTMTGRSTIIVQREHYPDGFYLVYVVNTDDGKCVDGSTIIPASFNRLNRTKEISFVIQEIISVAEFEQVIFIGTLGVYLGFIALVAATCLLVEYRRRRSERGKIAWEKTVKAYMPELHPMSQEESNYADQQEGKDETVQEAIDGVQESNNVTKGNNNSSSLQSETRVSDMTRHQPDFYNKKSKRYFSELCIIAVFYLIPVVQLIMMHKDMMVTTGDQDMCYYNFGCAYPYRLWIDFSDFNHFFSNIGYIVLGSIFVLITKRRDYLHTMMMQNRNAKERGIPPHYGLSYSMGFGLIVEGILSACYHLCPTRMNYQFDTSFMYVIAVLCTLKLYHARHADLNVKSYSAYISLALVVLIGAGTGFTSHFYFKLGFTVVHLTACSALAIDVYYMGQWKLDKERVVEHVHTCWKSRPLYLERLTLVILGIVCNVVFAVTQLVIDSVDFNTHLLAVFILNLNLYSIYYVVMKVRKREWAFATHCIYPVAYLVAALAFWCAGSYFFLEKAAKWEESPAESRKLNTECLLAEVYDTHDLWHFLSSAGLFFFFMFLLTLDDDIRFTPRDEIPVF